MREHAESDTRDEALRAWFDVTTDRIVREKRLPRREAERYAAYFRGCRADGEHFSRREHYAHQVAIYVASQQVNHGLLLLLLVGFFVGVSIGYRIGRAQGIW